MEKGQLEELKALSEAFRPKGRWPGETGMGVNKLRLDGLCAVVTGGSKGLGKAMARGLAEAGADIVISSRHEDELRPALDEILRATGRAGRYVVADMAKRDRREVFSHLVVLLSHLLK